MSDIILNQSKYNSDWEPKKLFELGTFSRGISKHRPRNDNILFVGGGYPFIQTGDIRKANLFLTHHVEEYGEFGLKQSKLWPTGTLCITIAANIAETAILAYPMCFPDSVVGFIANTECSSELFMYYIFEYIKHTIKTAATGSAQDNINIEYLSSIKFRIPNKTYQDRIVSVLSSVDKKISLNKSINDNLEKQLRTIYDYWFTQFDFPDENGNPYRSSGGKMVWNDELKREIPEGWECRTLGSLLHRHQQAFDYKSEQPTVDLSIMPLSSIAIDQTNSSSMFATNLYWMHEGDLLFGSIRPYLKKAGIAPCDGVAAGTVHCFQVNDEQDYNFALFTLCGKNMFDYAIKVSKGTKMPVVSAEDILSYKVPYSKEISRLFNAFSIQKTICNNVKEMHELTKLRDWLLPMLMNGQATVAD